MNNSPSKSLRIAFMGTPDFVVPVIKALQDSVHDLVCIYTQPPREKGRKREVQKTPAHLYAEEQNIEVRFPENFKTDENIADFKDLNLDVAVVAAFGMLLPQSILEAPQYGCINIHPSLLPRWRGPSPIQYAIWKGDAETGVSVMSLEKKMDTGPLLAQEKIEIGGQNFLTLNDVLWQKGTKNLIQVLDDLAQERTLSPTPQSDDGVIYCKLLKKEDGHIDWTQSAIEIDQQVRGLNPWPGTWSMINGKRFKVLEVKVLKEKSDEELGLVLEEGKISCGGGSALQLLSVQPENKKPMDIKVALNGGHLKAGDRLK